MGARHGSTPALALGGARSAIEGPVSDNALMQLALAAAADAAQAGEVPVGAVVFDPYASGGGAVVEVAANACVGTHDPTAHAEIVALRAAASAVKNYRLTGLWLAVTLEPCAMCAGAISLARIGRLIYGASDPKGGGVAHGAQVFDQPTCHWRPEVVSGVEAEASAALLRRFFQARRT